MTQNLRTPLVSVVIPTRGRPTVAMRAIGSALSQTFENIEVIVVVDGTDPATADLLTTIPDPRLRAICLAESVGGSEARNTGARAAKGSWIAFLDDDDEWLPEKIQAQVMASQSLSEPLVFIASRFIERSHLGDRVLPVRRLEPGIPFSEFLFCRKDFRSGTGYAQTSTWFVSKQLMDLVPFTKGLPRNQDVDWMIHAMAQPTCRFLILEDPLTIFHDHGGPDRVSKRPDWKFQYDWAIANRAYLTPKALAFCIATLCVPDAVRQKESLLTFLKLWLACLRTGGFGFLCFGFFCYNWLVSNRLRTIIRSGRSRALKVSTSL
jgi:glycosyltransferase involved in cell wall biosynthesis